MIISYFFSCAGAGKNEIKVSLQDCYKERKVEAKISNQQGIVKVIADQYYLVTQDQQYLPCDLPIPLKMEGKKVVFGGDLLEVFPHERWAGLPFHLKVIKTGKQ